MELKKFLKLNEGTEFKKGDRVEIIGKPFTYTVRRILPNGNVVITHGKDGELKALNPENLRKK